MRTELSNYGAPHSYRSAFILKACKSCKYEAGQPAYSDKAILADQSSPSQQPHLLQKACCEKEHMPWGLAFPYAHKYSKMFCYS